MPRKNRTPTGEKQLRKAFKDGGTSTLRQVLVRYPHVVSTNAPLRILRSPDSNGYGIAALFIRWGVCSDLDRTETVVRNIRVRRRPRQGYLASLVLTCCSEDALEFVARRLQLNDSGAIVGFRPLPYGRYYYSDSEEEDDYYDGGSTFRTWILELEVAARRRWSAPRQAWCGAVARSIARASAIRPSVPKRAKTRT